MSYYARNPYEEPEDPRCLHCDEFMTEIPDWFDRVWECRNPACDECSPKYQTQDNYWNPIEREWDTPEEDKAWESLENGINNFFSIEDLPFSDKDKRMVLEWFARKLWVLLEEGSSDSGKIYDPLVIDLENNIAHSYVFDLEDGSRHHSFKDLEHLEKMLMDEGIARINAMRTRSAKLFQIESLANR